ncbi:MAG TPA: ATP-binding cassette domain-containing protein [Steroidobacteraceae bacterium]|nr:ATP-binding cassette domain-containing protein [Steroidobacteraceae bacterium]
MQIARLDKVSLSFGAKPLLDRVGLLVAKGERVCVLGRNGEGKSSLLKLIAREIAPDGGELWIRPGAKVASLAQEVSAASGDTVRELILREAAAVNLEGDWQAALQTDQIIARLGLDADAALGSLSGGWRRRAMLGRALVTEPDLLLLDEPTNHLDIDAITWLEELMSEFAGALVFVSHDRAFVRRLATRVVDLDRGQLREWSGDYDTYVLQKRAALDAEAKQAALFDKKLAQEEVWIRQGVEARRTRNEGRVRALKQLRIERRERREVLGQVDIKADDASPSGKLVFEASEVYLELGGTPLIVDFSTRIMRGDRIGIIGPNGCGKSTLIKLLVGELEPRRGSIYRGTSLKVAYFDQQRESLDPAASIMDNVTAGSGDMIEVGGRMRHVSGYLRDFLFPPDRLLAPVSMLSGGERNRLMLAKLFAKPSNLLVMDEPTNDLDAETLDLLEELVADYAGTLLLVSHDRAFLDNVVTSTLVFEGGGRIEEYVGGYSDAIRQRQALVDPPGAKERARKAARPADDAGPQKPRKLSYKDQRELDALPAAIEQLEAEQASLQAALGDPALFQNEPNRAREAAERWRRVAEELQAAYARWELLESGGVNASGAPGP